MADIFERLRNSEPIHMIHVKEYHEVAHKEMDCCRKLCFTINQTYPERDKLIPLERELFQNQIADTSFITPPFQVDYACQMTLESHVFINHGMTCMSAGGITLEEGVMIGPDVSLLTVNHDKEDLQVIICKSIVIKKGAWIGAKSIIMPGITVGEGAIVGSGSVVTPDVEPHTTVVGNPARVVARKW